MFSDKEGASVKRAWTLVELLVVSAIVCVLAGILTSVFMVARASARATNCMANLVNIDRAFKLYQGDYDGRFPPHPWLEVHGMTPRRQEFIESLAAYKIKDLVWCPSDSHEQSGFIGEWHDFMHSSYVLTDINLAMLSKKESNDFVHLSADWVAAPATTVQSLDQTWIVKNEEDGTRSRHSAHGKKVNAIYVDGHAKALPVGKP